MYLWPQYIQVRKLFKGGNYSRKYGNLLLFYQFPDCFLNNPLYWHFLYFFDQKKWSRRKNKQLTFKQLTENSQKSNWRTKKTQLLRKLKIVFCFIHKIFAISLCFAWQLAFRIKTYFAFIHCKHAANFGQSKNVVKNPFLSLKHYW